MAKDGAKKYNVWTRVEPESRKSDGMWPATQWHVTDMHENMDEALARNAVKKGTELAELYGTHVTYQALASYLNPNNSIVSN